VPLTTIFEPELGATISIGDSISGRITSTQYAVIYPFNANEGDIIDVSMQATSGDLDPFLIVLDPSGAEIARNDDDALSGTFNSLIAGLRLTQTGRHAVVATRFFQRVGDSTGEFNLSISSNTGDLAKSGTFSETIEYNSNRSGIITDEAPQQVFVFEGSAGDTISIRMSRVSGDLDTLVQLEDNLGNQIAQNDDDLGNQRFDSFIREIVLPKTGPYSIVATRFQSSNPDITPTTGNFRLELTVSELNTSDLPDRTMGIIDIANAGTVFGEEMTLGRYVVGDVVNDLNEDVLSQAFFTYILPPLPEERSVDSATLEFTCIEFGLGFSGLQTMSVFEEEFDTLDVSVAAPPGENTQAIVKLDSCRSIIVTDIVSEAYEDGSNRAQFRLRFENIIRNRENDNLEITNPRLVIRLRET